MIKESLRETINQTKKKQEDRIGNQNNLVPDLVHKPAEQRIEKYISQRPYTVEKCDIFGSGPVIHNQDIGSKGEEDLFNS